VTVNPLLLTADKKNDPALVVGVTVTIGVDVKFTANVLGGIHVVAEALGSHEWGHSVS
jgi:hypothetical protein